MRLAPLALLSLVALGGCVVRYGEAPAAQEVPAVPATAPTAEPTPAPAAPAVEAVEEKK